MKNGWLLKKAHGSEVEADSEGTWALSYGDMITLLLSFFVIFFTTDFKKEQVDKLNRHLSFALEGTSEIKDSANSDLKERFAEFKSPDMKAKIIGDMVVVSFGKVSFFRSGGVKLHPQGQQMLETFARSFLPYAGSYRLSLKGFTDKRPIRYQAERRFRDNLELSALRSLAAIRSLQKSGIPLERMEIAGVGEMGAIDKIIPRANELTEAEVLELSRTIVIVIKPEKESWL